MRGITLIEVLVVVAIFTLLAVIAAPSFNAWRIKMSIESDIKNIYAFLQKVRATAFSQKRDLSVSATGRELCLQEGSVQLECIELNNSFTGTVGVSRRGYFNITGTIRYTGSANVSRNYDCVVVSLNRIRMGVWNGTNCQVK